MDIPRSVVGHDGLPLPHIPSKPLSQGKILDFYNDLDRNAQGFITLEAIRAKLRQVYEEFTPSPLTGAANIDRPSWLTSDLPRSNHLDAEHNAFGLSYQDMPENLRNLFPDREARVSKDEFIRQVQGWKIPSSVRSPLGAPATIPSVKRDQTSLRKRLRGLWLVEGSRIMMISFIMTLQVVLGAWGMVKYLSARDVRSVFSWGVMLSKTAAGALYPTMFFMILSMSRYFATLIRRFKYLPRLVNWDRSQSTHVWMAIVGLVLATLHAIGYLTGVFIHSIRPDRQLELVRIMGPNAPTAYGHWMQRLPVWSGLIALGLYYVIAVLSLPAVRRRSYETFQIGHLLMFPFIGLLCIHGTTKILQYPMLGFWIAVPTLLVLFERSSRLAHGLRRVPAKLHILDDDTVTITFNHPRGNWWNYEAGQYIFLQVPSISFFQWHPLSISSCSGKEVQVHIRTQGGWAERLRSLPTDRPIQIGVDGPFGAPSQRFYEFERAIIIGAGVGITPFAAIMTDLEQKLGNSKDPWDKERRVIRAGSRELTGKNSNSGQTAGPEYEGTGATEKIDVKRLSATNSARFSSRRPSSLLTSADDESIEHRTHPERRVDFYWLVREKNDFRWFASQLNRAYDLSLSFTSNVVQLNIKTHITTRQTDIIGHIFRSLLDTNRTRSCPRSALTGLTIRSHCGRPDLSSILQDFDTDMKNQGWTGGRVSVFFCGKPSIGRELADSCAKLTSQSRQHGSRIRYIFMMEVFG